MSVSLCPRQWADLALDRADLDLDPAALDLDPADLARDRADLDLDPAALDRAELHLPHWREMASSSWARSKSSRKARRARWNRWRRAGSCPTISLMPSSAAR